jgi:CPA1 family monovalent cation:H+ antiporter
MSSTDIAGLIVVLAAVLSLINYKLLHLPNAVGLTVLGLAISLAAAGLDVAIPDLALRDRIGDLLDQVDFNHTLMTGMLSFLLFAGAVQLDMNELYAGRYRVLILSIAGVLISTIVTGYGLFYASMLLNSTLPLPWCMMFGALISPTDPVAVIALLRRAGVPLDVETRVSAESLFNDGVGVVVFSIAYAFAVDQQPVSALDIGRIFLMEAAGGVLFGLVVGWIAYRSMKAIDDPHIETMITLALVMGGYSLSGHLGTSPVVAMAVAGVVIARLGKPHAMSERSRTYILGFWKTIDEILNSVLFLLIGLEVIVIFGSQSVLWLSLAAIPIVLAGRAISVAVPMAVVSLFAKVDPRAYCIFVWGGLRGGIPVALALSLPDSANAHVLTVATYCVVLFSLLVQGGTLGYVARRLYDAKQAGSINSPLPD